MPSVREAARSTNFFTVGIHAAGGPVHAVGASDLRGFGVGPVGGDLGTVVHTELAVDTTHVVANRLLPEMKPCRDLLVAHALVDHPQHLGLPPGQTADRRLAVHPVDR